MTCQLPENLLTDLITIKRSVQSYVSGTKRPVFEFQVLASGIKSWFVPQSTALNRNVLGQNANPSFLIFLNLTDITENDEVVRESSGKEYVIKEVKDFFSHHLEVSAELKRV